MLRSICPSWPTTKPARPQWLMEKLSMVSQPLALARAPMPPPRAISAQPDSDHRRIRAVDYYSAGLVHLADKIGECNLGAICKKRP
ncbi:MAG TPA: hypothetical protein VMW23_04600 [Sedimentisphaerales bacterium]|nr:hypothetical protein [Sedimentisphaerales bacterium]